MSKQIENVSLATKANVYFDGKCVSHSFTTSEGAHKSVGVILPSKLVFNTVEPEKVELIEGRCRVRLKGEVPQQDYVAGDSFSVPGNSSFEIEALETLHYVCHFG